MDTKLGYKKDSLSSRLEWDRIGKREHYFLLAGPPYGAQLQWFHWILQIASGFKCQQQLMNTMASWIASSPPSKQVEGTSPSSPPNRAMGQNLVVEDNERAQP